MTKIVTVQGLQWGSEAKGAIASLIAHLWHPDVVAAAWQPNAGHTAYVQDEKYVHSMLPLSALAPSVESILIGPGAVVDVTKLVAEIGHAARHLRDKEIIIHPRAAVLWSGDAEAERYLVKIGSTMKGSTAATIRKINRSDSPQARIMGEVRMPDLAQLYAICEQSDIALYIDQTHYDHAVQGSGRLLLEGAQGYGLGVHTRFYPYCTSRDVSTAQLLADCRVPVGSGTILINVGVCRTFPIRVANRFDAEGNQIGTSGGCYGDQRELDWRTDLGREPELTTVTKLPRRIFSWSRAQVREACHVIQPDFVAMTFCDYVGVLDGITMGAQMKAEVRARAPALPEIAWVTTGPRPEDAWRVEDIYYGRLIAAMNRGVPW